MVKKVKNTGRKSAKVVNLKVEDNIKTVVISGIDEITEAPEVVDLDLKEVSFSEKLTEKLNHSEHQPDQKEEKTEEQPEQEKKEVDLSQILEELQKLKDENEQIKEKLNKPLFNSYEDLKKSFEEKTEIIKKIDKLQSKKMGLIEVQEGNAETGDFQDVLSSLTFERNHLKVTVSNKFIIDKFLSFILVEIDNKINELETQLLKFA